MPQDPPDEFPMQVKLPQTTRVLASREEILEWLNTEVLSWEWAKAAPCASECPVEPLEKLVKRCRDQTPADWLRGVETKFREMYEGDMPAFIVSESPTGQFLLNLRTISEVQARWALVAIKGRIDILQEVMSIKGSAQREALFGVFKVFAHQMGLADKVTSLHIDLGALEGRVANTNREFSVMKEKFQVELDGLIAAYRKAHTAKETVTHWQIRKDSQRRASIWWGLTALGIVIGLCVYLHFIGESLNSIPADAGKLIDDVRAGIADTSLASTVLTQLFIRGIFRFALPLSLVIWTLRIVVRNYISASHLATDAAEREVLIGTYLSLLAEPELLKNPELRDKALPYMLENIFRHSPDGLVKDDGSPFSSLLDLINKPTK